MTLELTLLRILFVATSLGLSMSASCAAGGSPDRARKSDEIIEGVSQVFQHAQALRMKIRATQQEGLIGGRQPDVSLDILMTDGGKFRIYATQEDKPIAQIVCDGQMVYERAYDEAKWTRYPQGDGRSPKLIMDHAGEPKHVFVISRYMASWLGRDSAYCAWLHSVLAEAQPSEAFKTIDGRLCHVITASRQMFQRGISVSMRAELAFDAETNLPVFEETQTSAALVILPALHSCTRFAYERIELNPQVPGDAFSFRPAEGSTFVDPSTLVRHERPQAGDNVPRVLLTDLDGKEVALSTCYTDRPALVVFWATWCLPCKQELADLEQFVEQRKLNQRLNIVAVSVDDSRTALGSFLQQRTLPFTVLHDSSGVRQRFGGKGVPATFLIDSKGIVRGRWDGWTAGQSAKDKLDEIYDALQPFD